MRIYLVRHGEVSHNVLKHYSTSNEDLTDIGIQQALELRDKIKDIKFDIVISSPLLRATHTENILTYYDDSLITDFRLGERDCGSLNGQPLETTNREEYWNYYSTIKYGTSEDIKGFFERVFDFLDELKTKDYDNVLIVAHSGVSKAFYAYFNGIPEDGNFLNLGLGNCEIKEYVL